LQASPARAVASAHRPRLRQQGPLPGNIQYVSSTPLPVRIHFLQLLVSRCHTSSSDVSRGRRGCHGLRTQGCPVTNDQKLKLAHCPILRTALARPQRMSALPILAHFSPRFCACVAGCRPQIALAFAVWSSFHKAGSPQSWVCLRARSRRRRFSALFVRLTAT
jgi:hypothetical protein